MLNLRRRALVSIVADAAGAAVTAVKRCFFFKGFVAGRDHAESEASYSYSCKMLSITV